MEGLVQSFLKANSGNGSDYGYGDCFACGAGEGYGYGCGSSSALGYGCGSSPGYGSDIGYGSGPGHSSGCEYGSGYGYGFGTFFGSGDGILMYEDKNVYTIDTMPTIIYTIHNNIARGAILKNDLTLQDCYIVKVGNSFAHGDTIKDAYYDALRKGSLFLPIEDRINNVVSRYPDINVPISNHELYILHNWLTGSCEFGRKEFARENGLDINSGSMTMREFIELTENAYGGEVIKQLKESYAIKKL